MKNILLAFIFGLSTLVANAQQREKGDFELIPYLGYSESYLNGDNSSFYGVKNSVTYGVKGDYFFNDRWSFRSGLQYDSMGASFNSTDLDINYLSIPLNANWHFGSTRKWNLNFGLTPSFLLDAEAETGEDLSEEVKSFQLGISYGIGYKLEISEKFSLLFDLQGNVGITNVNDIKNEVVSIKQMNAFSSINIGGVFKL